MTAQALIPSIAGYWGKVRAVIGQNRGFRWLMTAQALAYLNIEVWYIALPFLILQQTQSPLWMGVISTLGYLPSLVASSPSGWWVDHTSARKVLVVSAAIRAGLFLLLATLGLTGHLTLPILAVICFVLGIFGVAQLTAKRTLIPSLIPGNQIPLANSLDEGSFGFAEMFGTLGGGFAVAFLGPYYTMLIQVGLLVGCVLASLQIKDTHAEVSRPAKPRFGEGFEFLIRKERVSRILLSSLLVASVVHSCCMVFFSMQVFYYGSVLGLDSDAAGWMIFAVGGIGLVGSLMTDQLIEQLGVGKAILLFAAVVSAGLFLVAATTHPAWVVCGAGLILSGGKAFRITRTTLCQQLAPKAILGRVNGAYHMFAEGVTPLAVIATGFLAKAVGFPATFSIAGAFGIAACLYYFVSPLNGLTDAHTPTPAATPHFDNAPTA